MQWVKKSTIYSNSKNVVLLLSSQQEKLKNVLFRVDNRQLLFVLFHRFFSSSSPQAFIYVLGRVSALQPTPDWSLVVRLCLSKGLSSLKNCKIAQNLLLFYKSNISHLY
jgi:hypothetical protein